MSPELYLIAPADIDAPALLARLRSLLERQPVAALLLPRGTRDTTRYHAFIRTVAPPAQERNVAVLIEGEPEWVTALGVDGLHVTGGLGAVKSAVESLKPGHIVGAGDIRSRHDAMQKGEIGIDYILFGPLSGRIDAAQRELAEWWAETMEIPCVLADPDAPAIDAGACEFAGVGVSALEQPA